MKNLYLIFISNFFLSVYSQSPQIQWQKSLGGSNTENAAAVVKTNNGYVIVGDSKSIDGDIVQNIGNTDAWISKLNFDGGIIWQKNYGGTLNDRAQCIRQTNDGGFIIVGGSYSSDVDVSINKGHEDLWIFKIDSDGNLEWEKTYGGTLGEFAASVELTTTGGFIVIGSTSSNDGDVTNQHGVDDVWALCLDATGIIIWQKCLGGTGPDIGKDIIQTSDGGFILVGDVQSMPSGDITTLIGSVDIWVVKLDVSGNIEWQKSYGGSNYERSEGIEQITDGYVIGGETASNDGDVHNNHPVTAGGHADFWVFKINNTGTIQWETTFGGTSHENAFCFRKCSDNNFIIGGLTFSNNDDIAELYGVSDCLLAKVDSNGNLLWNKTYGGTEFEQLLGFDETSDNEYILACTSYSNNTDVTGNHGNSDIWVVKLEPETLSNPVFSTSNLTIYPNPVTNLLHIETQKNIIACNIYDMLGKKIMQPYQTSIDVSELQSGMYIIELFDSNNEISTHKFIKL